MLLGVRLGHSAALLSVLCLAGVGAALGVRNAANHDRFAVVGVLPLWLAALVFTGVASALVGNSPGPAVATLAIAGAALLGPFGVVGNTVRTYGEGTGRTLLGRYLAGTLVLAGLVVAYGLLLAVVSAGLSGALGTSPGAGVGALLPGSLGGRIFVAAVLYPLGLYLLSRASDRFPAAVFVPFHDLDSVQQSRERIDAASSLGWKALGGLVALTAVGYAARFSAPEDSSTRIAETIEALTLGVVGVVTARPVLVVVLLATVLAVLVLVGVYVVREYGTASATVLTQTVGPPLALAVTLVVATTLFSGLLPLGALESVAGDVLVTDSPLHRLLTDFPSLLVLVVSTVAILASAVVFSVPTALAAGPAIDDSLAGLAAAVLALLVFVLAAVVDGEPAVVVVLGVAIVALVWELGEYATVAAGELRTESVASGLPPGFSTLASIHAVASVGVAVGGAALAAAVAAVAGGASLPGGFALLAVIVSVLGLAGLMLLLTG